MAPRTGWASKEEWEYLTSLMPEYEACQVRKRYKPFWQRVNTEFLTKFPVIEKLYPGRKVGDLQPEEREMYTAAVARQQQRLKEWFRWQLNPRSRNSGTVLSKKDLRNIYHGRTRVLKPYEAFAKLYPIEVETEKKARCAALGISGRETLTVWHEAAKDLYKSATPEQLEAVRNRTSCDREGEDDSFEEGPAREYSRYIRKLPSILDAAITPAVRKAGVLAFITVVGPNPEQNGKITCKSFQFGDKEDTPVFSQVWDGHDTIFVEELARFARRHEFPPEVCAARSLNAAVKPLNNTPSESSQENDDISGKVPSRPKEDAPPPNAPITAAGTDAPAKALTGTVVSPDISIGAPPETAAIAVTPQPSFSVSDAALSKESLFQGSAESQQVQRGEDHCMTSTDGGFQLADPGPLFLERDDDADEEGEDSSLEQWNFSQETWNEIDERLGSLQFQPSSLPPSEPSAPLHVFPELAGAPQSAPSLSFFSTSSATNNQSTPLRDDINMFNDLPDLSQSRSSTSITSALASSGTLTPNNSGPIPPFPRPRPVPRTPLGSSIVNGEDDSLQSDMFNLSRRRSAISASGYSQLASIPAPPHPSRSLVSTPRSSAQISPSSPFVAPLEEPQPTYASRFLTSLLVGNNAAKSKPSTSVHADNNGKPFSAHIPGTSQDNPISPSTNPASQIHNIDSPFARPDPISLAGSFRHHDSMRSQFEHPPQEAVRRSVTSSISTCPPTVPGFAPMALTPACHTLSGPAHPPFIFSPQCTNPNASAPVHQPIQPDHGSLSANAKTVVTNSAISQPHLTTLAPGSASNSSALTSDANNLHLPSVSAAVPPAPVGKLFAPTATSGSLSSQSGSSVTLPPTSKSSDIRSIPKPRTNASSTPVEGSAEEQEGDGTQIEETSVVTRRRSTRVPKSAKAHVEKATGPTLPAWFAISMDYLESVELGEDWNRVVTKWSLLEASMGYGQPSRGPISAQGRPDAWTQWINRTWQGLRRYDKFPSFEEPAELGIQMCKWWNSMQPSFRAPTGKSTFPRSVYRPRVSPTDGQDVWANLRKPGPNGFISVLMLMSWWGTAIADASEWAEDSSHLWKRLLDDIIHVLDAMNGVTTAPDPPINTSGKRPPDKENAAPVTSKRKRK